MVMEAEKIDGDFSPAYTPQLNGTAERLNQTLGDKIRCFLLDSGIPGSMRILAAEAAVHVYNRTPIKNNNFKVPLKVFAPNVKLHLDKIKRFGCIAYVYIPKPETKFSERALRTVLVGFTNTGYLLWHPPSGRFIVSRNVQFNEKLVYRDVFGPESESMENHVLPIEQSEENLDVVFMDQDLQNITNIPYGHIKRPKGKDQKGPSRSTGTETKNSI